MAEPLVIQLVATAVLQALLIRLKQSVAVAEAVLRLTKVGQVVLAEAAVLVLLLVQPSVAREHQAKEMLAVLVS